jgi:hypothetical protein
MFIHNFLIDVKKRNTFVNINLISLSMKKSTVILMWGLITGIVSAIFFQILKATGQDDSGLRWINVLIMFSGLFVGTMQYRDKANGGYLTFGEGFKAGFFMVLIVTLLAITATLVDMQMHPDFIDKVLDQARTNMINKGLPADQIDISMEYVKKFTTPVWIVASVVILELFFGAILSLITAAISIKKKPMFEDANEMPTNETNS